MKGQQDLEQEAARLRAEYAQKTPAEMARIIMDFEQRQAWIDANLTAEIVMRIFDPFMERVLSKRSAKNAPTLDTQCVTLVLPSTKALVRRMQDPLTDKPIVDLLFEPLAEKQTILSQSALSMNCVKSKSASF